ncbi:hypothetical protein H1C71_027723 [Ictidomys tridecemlineatus]|nr:hypothetical protein H1C71_027723 [Ictidomys tridecemlineatus]
MTQLPTRTHGLAWSRVDGTLGLSGYESMPKAVHRKALSASGQGESPVDPSGTQAPSTFKGGSRWSLCQKSLTLDPICCFSPSSVSTGVFRVKASVHALRRQHASSP